jgi:OFA family oxalate/formate antiporter-like MFS transporter
MSCVRDASVISSDLYGRSMVERRTTMVGARSLMAAVLTNSTMGLLYIWSLFLQPLESRLSIDRSTLSLVPAVALVMFTAGMYAHDGLLRRLGLRVFIILTFGLAGLGHILFGFWPTYPSLLIGYGVLFGCACGLGYGLSLALAGRLSTRWRAVGISITVAAFAVSGIVLASILPAVTSESLTTSFAFIGAAILAIGLLLIGLIIGVSDFRDPQDKAGRGSSPEVGYGKLLLLGVFFFLLCYPGLMIVSHSTGVLQQAGTARQDLFWGPVVLNCAYVAGSLVGGPLTERVAGRTVLILALGLETVALFGLSTIASLLTVVVAMAMIGVVLGGAASLMPVLIIEQFGAANLGAVYGRIMVGYGAAGLLAPWVTASLYNFGQNYRIAVLFTGALVTVGLILAVISPFAERTISRVRLQ